MKQKYFAVLHAIVMLGRKTGETPTVGEIAKFLNISKSTARNRIVWLFGKGLAHCEKVDYKKTGKYLIYATSEGISWINSQKVMVL